MQRHRKATRATRSSTTPKVDANTRHVAVATRLNYRDKGAGLPFPWITPQTNPAPSRPAWRFPRPTGRRPVQYGACPSG